MTATTTTRTTGIHHLGLTVPDIEATARFFEDGLGFTRVGGKPDYPALFLSDGAVLMSLWQADATGVVPFDRRHNVGLHHVALRLAEPSTLDRVHEELAARADTVIEFAPELLGAGPTRHMMCAIPGGVRLELIAPVTR